MRDHLLLYINGRRHEVRGADAFLTLSEFVRTRLRLTGTKVVCAEGDCGSCSVLVGRLADERLNYRPIDSCIQLMFQLDGTHVITIEGLRRGKELTPIQEALVTEHGSQCGYCTPGFVVAMTGLLEANVNLTEESWRCGLTGNLCRCTGYAAIFEAALYASNSEHTPLNDLYEPHEMLGDFERSGNESFEIQSGLQTVHSPVALPEALRFLASYPQAKVIAGGTDVGVQLNKRIIAPAAFLDLSRLEALQSFSASESEIQCGALTRWSDLEFVCRQYVPAFADIIAIFGSPQIRHVGTIGGNIVNASPIADSLPFLFVMEAEVEIIGPQGSRSVNIIDFYLGYRKTDLKSGELLTKIRIPLPNPNEQLALYKVSRRRDLDIASFTAAILLEESSGQIRNARISLGAVGPTVLRARKTEAFLSGKPFSESVMRAAGEMAVEEISPISDVRGSADFRWQLTRNVFVKFFHERMLEAA